MGKPHLDNALALGRARLAAGRRSEARESFQSVIEGEEQLRPAWEGLRAAADGPDEIARAEAWLAEETTIAGRLRDEWHALRGDADTERCVGAFGRVARLRDRLGMRVRARRLLLLARGLELRDPAIHREILRLFDRPEDAFVRIHSLEALVRLEPDDEAIKRARLAAYAAIGFAPPEGR
jgi:hypothetical protein